MGRLEKKEQSVQEHRADWNTEKESLNSAKEAHAAAMAAHSDEMLSRDKLILDIKAEVSTAQDFEDIISKQLNDSVTGGEDHISMLDSEVLKFEAAVDESNQNVISAEAIIESLQDEISSIDVRVPILEADKKLAASKRDFKAAGKASKEIKDALARKEQCEAELVGEALQRKNAAKEELEKASSLLEEKKSIALEKGQEAGKKQMETLREKINELKSLLTKFGNSESDEPDIINVACVGAFVIESRISVLEAEGKSLGDKYGGWESDDTEDASVHSAPTFDSAEEDNAAKRVSSTIIDASILEKFISLSKEIEELEAAIEKSVSDEDYDEAAELEEKVRSIRTEIESWGFLTEDLEVALRNSSQEESSPAASNDDNCERELKASPTDDAENSVETIDSATDAGTNEDDNLRNENKGDVEQCTDNAKDDLESETENGKSSKELAQSDDTPGNDTAVENAPNDED